MFIESHIAGVRIAGGVGRRDALSEAASVEAIVGSAFGVSVGDMHRACRGARRIAFTRQVAMYLLHTRLGLTLTDAGRHFGRDRTTAAHACHVVEACREDLATDASVEWLELAVVAWIAARIGERA